MPIKVQNTPYQHPVNKVSIDKKRQYTTKNTPFTTKNIPNPLLHVVSVFNR